MSSELAKVEAGLPAFMREEKLGVEGLAQFIMPPRIVVTQPLSKEPLDKYDPGTCLIMPNEQIITLFDKVDKCSTDPFIAVPVFFFVEYTLDNPRELHATKGAVRERTFDPQSEIAVRAQNPKLREVPCPDAPEKTMKYTTRLNYILKIMREDVSQAVLTTFKRGDMRAGMAFNSLIRARNASIFACQFMFNVGQRKNEQGTWYGLDASNPPEEFGPWVQNEELYNSLREEHLALAKAHAGKLIVPDYSGEELATEDPEM